jgi:Domain of unknown function (DUF4129)
VIARRAAPLLLAVAASLIVAIHGTNAQAPAPGVEFVAALQDAYDALPAADSLPGSDPRLDRVRAPLRLAATLAASGSSALALVEADLARDPADLADVRLRLRAMLGALALPSGSVAGDFTAARNALDDVYREETFSNLGAAPSGDSFFSRVGNALANAFEWIASHTIGTLGAAGSAVLAGLLLAAILTYLFFRLRSAGSRALRSSAIAEPHAGGLDAGAEWRRAEECAAAADFRQAVRHAFRSALLSAAERGRLQVDAAWTTNELLTRARGDADLVASLAPAAASFDQAWYSGGPVTQRDWEVARERCSAVRSLASRRGVAA